MNVLEELNSRSDWSVLATGRRDLTPIAGVSYIRADLTDAAATRAALTPAGDVTHLFFGAFQYAEDRYEGVRVNVEIFKNPLDALRAPRAPLRRVVSCEGSKAHGALMGPMRTPPKERDPRVPGQLFYFDQEDLLAARGAADGFVTTTLRPDFIAGIGLGSFANLVTVVAIHATVCKAQGLPPLFQRPVKIRLVARCSPIERGKRGRPPRSAANPTRGSGNATTALSAAMMMLHANAASNPPPRATLLTVA